MSSSEFLTKTFDSKMKSNESGRNCVASGAESYRHDHEFQSLFANALGGVASQYKGEVHDATRKDSLKGMKGIKWSQANLGWYITVDSCMIYCNTYVIIQSMYYRSLWWWLQQKNFVCVVVQKQSSFSLLFEYPVWLRTAKYKVITLKDIN